MKQLIEKTKVLSVFLLVLIMGCDTDDALLPKVISSFTYTVNEDTGTVTFINISEQARTYTWDFGDGDTSTEINPIKTYTESGTYTVSLTATNNSGASAIFEDDITIVIKVPITLPITFDNVNVNYNTIGTFAGSSFEIVQNPDVSGTNNKSSNVGAITNIGAAFEGVFFDLGTPVDLSADKTITMNFWAEDPIDVLLKLENGTGPSTEITANHGGTGWETLTFDYSSSASFGRLTLFADGPGTTSGTFYVDDISQAASESVECTEETEENIDPANGDLKWTFLTNDDTHTFDAFGNTSGAIVSNPVTDGINSSCNVQQFVKATGCETFAGLGYELATALDFSTITNKVFTMKVLAETQVTEVTLRLERLPFPDTEPSQDRVASITQVGVWQELTFDFSDVSTGTFKSMIIYFERNAECDGDIYYFDDILQVATAPGDTTPPVIVLNGDATVDLNVGDTYTEQGATATDDVDGDITANIVIGGDTVDTNTPGTYVVTYNVSDAAGNAATQVTRTVNVGAPFDDGLLTNGDFENGSAPWILGVDDAAAAPVTTENGNSFYSVNVTTPDPGQPFLVNLSQKLEIVQGETYTLSFEAWSDTDRPIIAGIGLSGGSFANTTQTVNINTTRQTYSIVLTATDFGAADARVLFDLNGAAGLVNIDNVSLVLGGSGGDTTPPVISLNGDATVNINVGDSYVDAGATATDDTDGDISGNIVVGGDTVDPNSAGVYVITYNVSDAAGNAATQVTRTVNVTDPGSTNPFCQTQIQAFGGDAGSDIFISVYNVDAQTMRIEIESADADPVDTLVFPAGDWNPVPGISVAPSEVSPGVWAGEFFYGGGAPANVEFNILWSKVSFGGNWSMNAPGNLSTVPFDATCDTSGGGGSTSGCTGTPVAATSLPLDFEGCETFLSAFSSIGDGGVVPSLAVNPDPSGINTSDNVLRVVRASGINRWGGVQNSFPAGTIDITTQTFKVMVYSSVPDVTYRFELALDPQTDPVTGNPPPTFVQVSGGANTWTEIEFTFTGLPASPTTYNQLVIKPDNPSGSDGELTTEERIFYFDNLRLD